MNLSSIKNPSGRWLGLLAAMGVAVGVASGPAQAAGLIGSFAGNAYATFADVAAGPLAVGLGRSAYIPCPCQGTGGTPFTNSISGLAVGSALTIGAATSTILTSKTATTATITDSSEIAGVSLLGGMITADALTAVANVSATDTALTTTTAGSTFVNLKVAGQPIDLDVAQNTTISLAGLGSVTLRKTVFSKTATRALSRLDLISIKVDTANGFGLPVGATLNVGHAEATFQRTQPFAVTGGQAWGASANAAIGSTLQGQLGQVALVTVPCLGTDGKIVTNNVNDTTLTSVLSLGASTTTAFGGDQSGSRVAQTTAQVAGIRLLGGLIGASAITSVATETITGRVRTRSTAGTTFASLKVLGLTLPINVAPNTTITLPLLGRVIVNEQIVPTNGGKTVVNGLHIFITSANLLGLKVGSEVLVAHADAVAFPFPST